MSNRCMLRCWALLALGVLVACGNQSTPAGTAPTTAAPQAQAAAPTASIAQPAESAAIPDSLTPEGYHMLGRPDAPVTLVMYSDFL